jgi:hypothetical protein
MLYNFLQLWFTNELSVCPWQALPEAVFFRVWPFYEQAVSNLDP